MLGLSDENPVGTEPRRPLLLMEASRSEGEAAAGGCGFSAAGLGGGGMEVSWREAPLSGRVRGTWK